MPPTKLKDWHWKAVKDYCDGKLLRSIADKYKCHDGTIVVIAKSIGVTPRPTGFASYEIAHKWVLQARIDYERILNDPSTSLNKQS